MKIAVIGGGFAGVALCYYLSLHENVIVTLIDKEGIASGASGASCGLMHAFVGEQVRKSQLADEAFAESKKLIEMAQAQSSEMFADFSGIERISQTEEQKQTLLNYAQTTDDVSILSENRFFLHKGATIQTVSYLNALWRVCEQRGVVFEKKEVTGGDQLAGFDHIVFACGAGIFGFPRFKNFRLDCTKGQALQIEWPSSYPRIQHSVVAKGYIAKSLDEDKVFVGSTFERGFSSTLPDIEVAKADLLPKFHAIFPELILNCIGIKSGVRVTSKGHYFPLIGNVADNISIFTGLGSRGLLYHALFAKMLTNLIIKKDDKDIPAITKVLLSKNTALA